MTIKKVTVHASTSFNHPLEQYSSFKPGVTFEAEIEPGEDAEECVKRLQGYANVSVTDEKDRILKSIRADDRMRKLSIRIRNVTEEIQRLENLERLDDAKAREHILQDSLVHDRAEDITEEFIESFRKETRDAIETCKNTLVGLRHEMEELKGGAS